MGQITLQIPQSGQLNSTEDVKVSNDFTTLQTAINGNLDNTNLSPAAGILATQCAFTPGTAAGTVYAPPIVADTSGAVTANHLYVAQVGILGNTLTGVTIEVASASGNVLAALFNSGGTQVAVSASTAVGSNGQQVPFTGTYAPASGVYYVGVIFSGTPSPYWGFPLCLSANLTQGGFTMPGSITPPSTVLNGHVPFMATY